MTKKPKDDLVYLRHMLHEIAEIKRDLTRPERDSTVTRAVVRSIEVIGEAARNVSEPLRARYTQIPWRRMIGMRNILIHGYFDIDYEEIWKTVENDLPQLEKDLLAIVSKENR